MIDFVKVRILDTEEVFNNLKYGNIKYYSKSNDVNLCDVNSLNDLYGTEFILDENRYLKLKVYKNECIYLEGSIHSYLKGSNNNDFSVVEIHKSINLIEKLLFTSAENLKLTQFEFGINVNWVDCFKFLDFQFIGYDLKEFNRITNPTKKVKLLKEVSISNGLRFKIYCKDEDLLRIEIRIKNASFKSYQKRFCNINLSQLSEFEYLNLLKNKFMECFEKLMIIDLKQLKQYPEKLTPQYWKFLKEGKVKGELCESTYYNNRSKFYKDYINNDSLSKDKSIIRKLIELKFVNLLILK